MKQTKEMKMVAFNLGKVQVKCSIEQQEIIERVYYERIKEQKKNNIMYRFVNIVLGLFFMIILFVCYVLSVQWALSILIVTFYTVANVLNYIQLRREFTAYRINYGERIP